MPTVRFPTSTPCLLPPHFTFSAACIQSWDMVSPDFPAFISQLTLTPLPGVVGRGWLPEVGLPLVGPGICSSELSPVSVLQMGQQGNRAGHGRNSCREERGGSQVPAGLLRRTSWEPLPLLGPSQARTMGRATPVLHGTHPTRLDRHLFSWTRPDISPLLNTLNHPVTSYHLEPEKTDLKPKPTTTTTPDQIGE